MPPGSAGLKAFHFVPDPLLPYAVGIQQLLWDSTLKTGSCKDRLSWPQCQG